MREPFQHRLRRIQRPGDSRASVYLSVANKIVLRILKVQRRDRRAVQHLLGQILRPGPVRVLPVASECFADDGIVRLLGTLQQLQH